MAAAARAEARRKAILSRGTDRLAKLTTSARGEDAPAYMHDDPPLAHISAPSTRSFLGEESSNMPTPQRASLSPSPSPQPRRTAAGRRSAAADGSDSAHSTATGRTGNIFDAMNNAPPDPSVWLPEQQQQFMQALLAASGQMGAGGTTSGGLPISSPIGDPGGSDDPTSPPIDNPFAALMGLSGAGPGGPGNNIFPPGLNFPPGGGFQQVVEEPKEKTKLQKAMPVLHLFAVWSLLAYFVFWAEPRAYGQTTAGKLADRVDAVGIWRRWAELGQKPSLISGLEAFRLQVVPFFWAFTSLQLVLHSLRIFSGFDAVQPPTLLALALPSLPPPIPSLIMNGLKYMQMFSLFLDDLAGLVVGLGFIVYFSGWLAADSS